MILFMLYILYNKVRDVVLHMICVDVVPANAGIQQFLKVWQYSSRKCINLQMYVLQKIAKDFSFSSGYRLSPVRQADVVCNFRSFELTLD